MRALRVLVIALLAIAAFAIAGCAGKSVTIAGQGYTTGTQTKTLTCGTTGPTTGNIAYGEQGAGKLHVKVMDGKGATIHESGGGSSAGQAGESTRLTGESGTWTLMVDSGAMGYAGQWAITLTC